MTDFNDLLIKRRSIRQFEDKKVSHDVVMQIIKDSTMAPSSGNGQPWMFVVVHDMDMIKRLSDESKAGILADLESKPDHPYNRYLGVVTNEDFNVYYNAPCLVFIAGPDMRRPTYVDCTLAATYFMLAAADRGLGTCWIDLGNAIHGPEIRAEIGLEENHVIIAPIILGYPKVIPDPPSRNEPNILKVVG